jgi:hypothetical protein
MRRTPPGVYELFIGMSPTPCSRLSPIAAFLKIGVGAYTSLGGYYWFADWLFPHGTETEVPRAHAHERLNTWWGAPYICIYMYMLTQSTWGYAPYNFKYI